MEIESRVIQAEGCFAGKHAKIMSTVDQLLPRVELTDVLVEVDSWTGFSSELVGLEKEPRSKDHLALLYAALLAGACNIPLAEMAQSTGLDYQALWWVSTNYIREEMLKRATVRLVNYQHGPRRPSYVSYLAKAIFMSNGKDENVHFK